MVVRCYHSNGLDDTEQQNFADDVQSRLDGTGINGYFITANGMDWLEWEGDSDTVYSKYQEHVNDDRVEKHEVVEDVDINDLNTEQWRGHTQPDIHCELL